MGESGKILRARGSQSLENKGLQHRLTMLPNGAQHGLSCQFVTKGKAVRLNHQHPAVETVLQGMNF